MASCCSTCSGLYNVHCFAEIGVCGTWHMLTQTLCTPEAEAAKGEKRKRDPEDEDDDDDDEDDD